MGRPNAIDILRDAATNALVLELTIVGAPIKIADVHIDTDYNTKLAVTMKVQDKVFGWSIDRIGMEKLMVKLIADTKEFILTEVDVLHTDFKTNIGLSAKLLNSMIGITIEGELAKKFVIELLAMGTKVVLLETVIDTDMTTKLNVAVHLVNSLVGLQLKSEFFKKIMIIAEYGHQEWVLGDLAVDTDLKQYIDIHTDILNGFIKVVFTRDPTNVGALELSVAGSPIKITDVHIDTDYNTKLAVTLKLQGKVFGWIVERKGLEDLKVEFLVDAVPYVLAELSAATDLKTLELTLLNKLVGIKIDSVFLKEMELALVYNGEVIPIMHVTADLISPQKHINVVLTLKPLPVIAFDVFATAAADFIETQATLKVANLEFIDLKQKTQVTMVEMIPVKFINQFHYGLY